MDETVGWHHRLDGHEFEQTAEDSEVQRSLACCSSWSRKESDRTERLNNNHGGPGPDAPLPLKPGRSRPLSKPPRLLG